MVQHRDGGSQDRHDNRDIVLSQEQLQVLLDNASEQGADKALRKIGLENGSARKDIDDLRGLAQAVQTIRSTIVQTMARAFTIIVLGSLLGGLAVKLNVSKWFKPFGGG